MSVHVSPRLFSVEEYHRMLVAGVFGPDDRLELLEGGIIEMSPIGSRHAACVNKLNTLLSQLLAERGIVAIQNPVTINPHSELQPDVAVLRKRNDFYAAGHPRAADVLLIVEVADTSINYDRNLKMAAYAKAGIPEVWLIDLERDTIEVFLNATSNAFANVHVVRGGAPIPSPFLGDISLRVDEVLPESAP